MSDVSHAPSGRTVVGQVVARGLCVGCGVCVAACPRGSLSMVHDGCSWLVSGACEVECTSCLRVCPFWFENPDEDQIAEGLFGGGLSCEGIGRYRTLVAAALADESERLAASSGGGATWAVRRMLETGAADAAALVGDFSSGPSYRLVNSPRDVVRCAGSKYEYYHLADVLAEAESGGLRVVVVALPCAAKALRLLCERLPSYGEVVVGVLGLACGQNKSREFWRFVGSEHGLRPESVRVLDYRVKRPDRPSSDFGVTLEGIDHAGACHRVELSWLDDVAFYWSHKFFALKPCLYCDDLMAETADVTFMDAWTPTFESDARGTSFVIDRSGALEVLGVSSGNDASGLTVVTELSADTVVQSQSAGLAFKREALGLRLLSEPDPFVRAGKRVSPGGQGKLSDRMRWSLDSRIARETSTMRNGNEDPIRDARLRALVGEARRTDRLSGLLRRLGL
jgi:coenzyme F420 hydrogenase subunit beta